MKNIFVNKISKNHKSVKSFSITSLHLVIYALIRSYTATLLTFDNFT